jgi:hypothetical protein
MGKWDQLVLHWKRDVSFGSIAETVTNTLVNKDMQLSLLFLYQLLDL